MSLIKDKAEILKDKFKKNPDGEYNPIHEAMQEYADQQVAQALSEYTKPSAGEWETFCDRSYYDLWAVRPVGDKNFHSQKLFHVSTMEEATALKELLESPSTNKQSDAVEGLKDKEIEELKATIQVIKDISEGYKADAYDKIDRITAYLNM